MAQADLEASEDYNEFLEARALVKAFRSILGFEHEMRDRIDEARMAKEI